MSLASEIDVFASIIDELRAIAARSDLDRRGELVKLRKRLANQIVLIRDAGIREFGGAADPVLASDFRAQLSTVLNCVAMHQANWPAVTINEANIAYRRSAKTVAETNRAFIDWTRIALKRLG